MRVRPVALAAALTIPAFAGMAGVAVAQEYGGTGGVTQDTGDTGDAAAVLGNTLDREVPSAAGVAGTGARVAGVSASAPGTMPVTGGDVVGLGIIGISLVAGGCVLVRRSRRAAATV